MEYLVNNYFLFLDDYRYPFLVTWVPLPKTDRWVIARHYYDFVHIISNNGLPQFISWDYDLDRQPVKVYDDERPIKTGLDCALWLIEFCQKLNLSVPPGAIHSTNQTHGPKIAEALKPHILNAR